MQRSLPCCFQIQCENETEVQQKYRDVLKRAVIMQNKEATYLLLGIENQTDIHYAMPIRNMIYDSLQYGKQVMEIAAEHRKKKDRNGTQAEYLSGFTGMTAWFR